MSGFLYCCYNRCITKHELSFYDALLLQVYDIIFSSRKKHVICFYHLYFNVQWTLCTEYAKQYSFDMDILFDK